MMSSSSSDSVAPPSDAKELILLEADPLPLRRKVSKLEGERSRMRVGEKDSLELLFLSEISDLFGEELGSEICVGGGVMLSLVLVRIEYQTKYLE